jgi:cation:H+ antiporter
MPGPDWLPALLGVLASAAVIGLAGPRMVRVADRIADVTGLGEALVGAVLLGAATSLPDLFATVTPAMRGLPDLAVGNALGGVLGQTAFLAIADLAYRRANLEHAAASLQNLLQAALLLLLLGGVAVLLSAPPASVLGVHPGTAVLVGVYAYGLVIIRRAGESPMWRAVETDETRRDVAEDDGEDESLRRLLLRFGGLAVVLVAAGVGLGHSGEALIAATGLSGSLVGVFITGAGSSVAELVVSISAVRSGALTLAVGNVIGGNSFDTLLVGAADVAYRDGSVYAVAGGDAMLVTAVSIVATAMLLLGLLRRERHGPVNIGVESAAVLVLYVGTLLVLL